MKSRSNYKVLNGAEIKWLTDNYACLPENSIMKTLGIKREALDHYVLKLGLGLSFDEIQQRRFNYYQ